MSQQKFVDRKAFEEYKLRNGMTVHYYPDDSILSTIIRIFIPIGHLHNHHWINGAAHFWEHIALKRSPTYKDQLCGLQKILDYQGGNLNACTGNTKIVFEATIPADKLHLQHDLVEQIRNPLLYEEDVNTERGVIHTEKWSKGKFFPFNNEVHKAGSTNWLNCDITYRDQIFGSEEEIHTISLDLLREVQSYFFSPDVQIVATGRSVAPLLESLEQIPTYESHPLSRLSIDVGWAESPVTEIASPYHSHHTLVWGGYFPGGLTNELVQTVDFLGSLLCDGKESALFQEYREKAGILYTPSFDLSRYDNGVLFLLTLNVGQTKDIHHLQSKLEDTISHYLQDNAFLERMATKEMNDIKLHRAWNALKRADSAINDLSDFGRIIPVEEDLEIVRKCSEPNYLLSFLEQLNGPKTLHIYPEED